MAHHINNPNEDQLAAIIARVETYARERHRDDAANESDEEVSPEDLLCLAVAARKLLAMRSPLVDISEGEGYIGNAEMLLEICPEQGPDGVLGVAHAAAWPVNGEDL